MKKLEINGNVVEIDDKTAIGVTYQSYSVKKPAVPLSNVTNNFTIPATVNNLMLIGAPNNPHNNPISGTISAAVYDKITLNYWDSNEQLLEDATARVEEISGGRIKIFVFKKKDIWDILRGVKWIDFSYDYSIWLRDVKGFPFGIENTITGSLSNFLDVSGVAVEGSELLLTFFKGNLELDEQIPLENLFLRKRTPFVGEKTGIGGHFCSYIKSIFEYIEYTYSVDFLVAGGSVNANLWDDTIVTKMVVPIRNISVDSGVGDNGDGFHLTINSDSRFFQFTPYEDVLDKEAKTLYDFVSSFFKHMNVLVDEIKLGYNDAIALHRFDDLENESDVVDFSGNISEIVSFKPKIQGYAQDNRIKFKSVYEEGSEFLNSKIIESSNKNTDKIVDLLSIDAFVNAVIDNDDNQFIADLSKAESFKTFSFFVVDDLSANDINIQVVGSTITYSSLRKLHLVSLYDLNSEYNFLEKIIQFPKVFKIKKWISVIDLKNLKSFQQYYIKELGGSFFINKKTINPKDGIGLATLELIKVSNKTPDKIPYGNSWVDGVGNHFVDGQGNFFT